MTMHATRIRLGLYGLAVMGGAAVAATTPANARVTQVVIKQTESPAFGGKTFGAVGAYERISGQIIGEVDPKDPGNGVIVDIGLAQRNANGMVP